MTDLSSYPLAAVTELTLGSRFRTCITILLDLAVFGGGIPNLLVGTYDQINILKLAALTIIIKNCQKSRLLP